MAKHDFYVKQITRLANVFGKTKFPMERVELIWALVEKVSDSNLKTITDNFIADGRFAPTRKDFIDALRALNPYMGTQNLELLADEKRKYKQEEDYKKEMYQKAVNKFGEEKIKQFKSAYAKLFMKQGSIYGLTTEMYDIRWIKHLVFNKGNMELTLEEVGRGEYNG